MAQQPQAYSRRELPVAQLVLIACAVLALVGAVVLAIQSSQEKVYGLGWISAAITIIPASLAILATVLYWRSSRVFDRRRGWTPKA